MSYALIGEFTVTGARNRGNKPNPHGGELTKWYVDLKDEQGQPVKNESGEAADAYWQRKAGSEVTVGDKVYGKVEEGEHGLRFKLEQRPDGAPRASGTSSGGAREWKPESAYDPEKTARIGRAHAQEMAVRALAAMGAFEGKSAERLHELLRNWTGFFERDVNKAGQAASQGAGVASADPVGSSQGIPPATAPAPEKPSAEDMRDIEMALSTAGYGVPGAEIVAKYMLSVLNESELQRACNQLTGQDLEAQGMTLRAMRQRTERWTGSPLPVEPDPDETIPF
jgi:hypothetical protein